MAKDSDKEVSLPRLTIFKKFSLAVRQELADGEEVLESLQASIGEVEKALSVPKSEEKPKGKARRPDEDPEATQELDVEAEIDDSSDDQAEVADRFFGDAKKKEDDRRKESEPPPTKPKPKAKAKPKPKRKRKPKPAPKVVRVEDFLKEKGRGTAKKKPAKKKPAKKKPAKKKPAKKKPAKKKPAKKKPRRRR